MTHLDTPPGLETAERILHEAAALFRTKSFNGASMQDLATAVGITKSSLYHHYPSKQALLAEIVEVTMSRVPPLVAEIAALDIPAASRLHRAIALHTAESIRERDYLACFSEESRYLSPAFMALHREKKDRYEALFQQLIEDGIDSGEFVAQDPSLAVMAVLGMCDGTIRRYRPEDGYSPDDIATAFANAAIRGLGVHDLEQIDAGEAAL
jgi:AcrR family transcriptional regulator